MLYKETNIPAWVPRVVTLAISMVVILSSPVQAQNPSSKDCSSYIGPTKTVSGRTVGPKTCAIVEKRSIRNVYGVAYTRIEMGISGSIEGYTVKDNSRYSGYFSDVPEYSLAQRWHFGLYYHGIGAYQSEQGSGMTIFIPESPADWNGKMFITVHGSAQYPPVGELVARKPDQYNRLMGNNSYVGLMIDQGYAVAYTRRSGTKFGSRSGSEQVTLDDGTVLNDKAYDYHVGLIQDFTRLARNFVQASLGRKPTHTYYYGHSAGTALGHLINYIPGANLDADGNKIYDGMLADDAGGGLYMPTLRVVRSGDHSVFSVKPDDTDHLVFDEAHKKAFAYQIDIAHQAYAGNDYVLGDYISNKRQNARLLVEKGLSAKTRTYEIVGVSHSDAGRVWPSEAASQNLDLSGIFDGLIDVLDRWVEAGVEPPATRSDAYDLGDVNRDGRNENAAIELPEVACPTGVYYEFPPGVKTPGRTGFAAYLREPRPAVNADTEPLPAGFDKEWLEPLDSRGYLVDLNKNTVRDTRDSMEQAWRRRGAEGKRYGVLRPNERLTHARYVSCVAASASELLQQGLLKDHAALDYIRRAIDSDIGISASQADRPRVASESIQKASVPALSR
ncbi:MAG: hypothetical protein HY644_09135 [Acidobacteria bacterium]|nr:hypothetical protein [Acidobacteriota bacterium]